MGASRGDAGGAGHGARDRAGDRAGEPTGGLLAVHAHPDDETLSTGALLATWAAAGRPVVVVTCTRGERGEVIPAALAHLADDPAALAAHREGELAEALAALGVTDHVFLDADAPQGVRYTDSGMAWVRPGQAGPGDDVPADAFVRVPVADAAARLAALIRARRPDVVVGYEPGGGYGHPDHVAAHRVMSAAVRAAAEGSAAYRVPVVLWAAVDATALRAARVELATSGCAGGPASPAPEPPDAPGPSAAVPPGSVDVRVDVVPVLGRVVAAMAAHATQVRDVATWSDAEATVGSFALSNGVRQPILRAEAYVVDPGWPQGSIMWPVGVAGGIA